MSPQVGKLIGENLYVHADAIGLLPVQLKSLAESALTLAPEARVQANVLKIDSKNDVVSALCYPGFFDQAFPELTQSWRIHIDGCRVAYRSYAESLNPPVLHRKELLLPPGDPRAAEFERLTCQAEQLGLFADASLIGFKRVWEERIRKAGYVLDGHVFQPLGNDLSDGTDASFNDAAEIQRHRTALSRTGLSAPIQALARLGMLTAEYTYFDYGCGRGDDLSALVANGYKANGWDPHYAPDAPKIEADVTNLGFVINVIEDFDERIEALRNAFALTRVLLVVSTMLYGNATPTGKPFRDGFLTQRNTFQKYFTQSELKEFVETVLDAEAVAVAPGIMFVFANKEAEQRFLYRQQRNRHSLRVLGYRREHKEKLPRQPRPTRAQELLDLHGELVDSLWDCVLACGRNPYEDEFGQAEACVEAFGSWGRALKFVHAVKDSAEREFAARQRKADLTVYLALQLFSRRKPYRQLELRLQRDLKAQFGDYQHAQLLAQRHLLDAASPPLIDDACQAAATQGLGHYVPSDFLQIHASLIERLPALLRIYVGCGLQLYGDLDGVDLVKIHVRSGKLTLMKFDNFMGSPLPRMLERIKVRLRDQDIDFFTYGEAYEPPLLYFKSRYLCEDMPGYEEQLAFDEQLEALELFAPETHGLSAKELFSALNRRRLEVVGHALVGAKNVPNIDEPCGANFTYRDLVECGETWQRTRIANLPRRPDSYNALHALATKILDPVVEYFGMIRLTYGFACPALTKEVSGRIAPNLDQHAAHEVNRTGNPVCSRLGAAVDFVVEDEDMLEVAKWIAERLPFDRLYVYGPGRPIHVSYGPDMARQVTIMHASKPSARATPRTLSVPQFLDHSWTA